VAVSYSSARTPAGSHPELAGVGEAGGAVGEAGAAVGVPVGAVGWFEGSGVGEAGALAHPARKIVARVTTTTDVHPCDRDCHVGIERLLRRSAEQVGPGGEHESPDEC
jgi:hypothetical protein